MEHPPHVQRMEAELAELHDRIEKLDAFIQSNPLFDGLSNTDQDLMRIQSDAMNAYCSTLTARVSRAIEALDHAVQ